MPSPAAPTPVADPRGLAVAALLLCGCSQRQLGDAVDGASEGSTGPSAPAENQPPVARVDTLFTRQNRPVTVGPSAILANDVDPEGDPLFATILRPDTRGRVQVEDGMITYTPPRDFWGIDRFAYEIDDGRGGRASTEVLVYVAPTRIDLDTMISDGRGFEVEWQSLSQLLGVAGDVDGDGVDDLLFQRNDRPSEVAVMLVGADGTVKGRFEMLASHAIATAGPAGDFDGDGLADIVIGGCCSEAPNLHVVFGTTDLDPIDVASPEAHSVAAGGSNDDYYYFFEAPGAADINGDGLTDVVAAPSGHQSVFVLYGSNESEDIALSDLAEGDPRGFVLDYPGPLHAVGDFNADGFSDLLVARTIVLGGAYEGTVSDLHARGRAVNISFPNGDLPQSVTAAGDFDGDGFGDVLLGRTEGDPIAVWLVFGRDDLEQNVVRFALDAPAGHSSAEVAGVGDVNGDGLDDVLISAVQVDSGPDQPRAWVVYGNDERTSIDIEAFVEDDGGIVIEFRDATVHRPQPWVGAGEFNGDGVPDLVFGADGLRDWSVKVAFGVPTQDTCCIARDGWGCTNPEVAACVCDNLLGCCEDAWNEECVAAVTEGCGLCPA